MTWSPQGLAGRVISCAQLPAGAWLMRVHAPDIARAARPGTFVMVSCSDGRERLLRRPLSVHCAAGDDVWLLFNAVGLGTAWLARRQAGDTVHLLGPLGNGYRIAPGCSDLLLVAGGMGVAPLTMLARQALELGKRVTLLLGARTERLLCTSPMLPSDITVTYVTEDGSRGAKGRVTDVLGTWSGVAGQVFACGPLAMYRAMAAQTRSEHRPIQVSLEARMGCGFGICYGCTVKTRHGLKQACQDGPIFDLDDVLWDQVEDL